MISLLAVLSPATLLAISLEYARYLIEQGHASDEETRLLFLIGRGYQERRRG